MPTRSLNARGDPAHNITKTLSPQAMPVMSTFALVHMPVPMNKAMQIPEARKAVEKEWKKLEDKKAWLVDTVRSKQDVIREAKAKGKQVHFGSLMDLCHVKNSQLSKDQQSYKGRVVFRGDQVRDETGFFAVFSEQGTSAAHQAAAKFLDALARMPGNSGADSDAVGAYTQAELGGVETWISLPRHRQPASWANIQDPVCRLRLNLYGHPLAGLYWEKHCRAILLENGFEPVPGWECLYFHRSLQLFLSVYVDDFKMAGKEKNMDAMWAKLSEKLDLEPPTPLDGNIYLGCKQDEVKVNSEMLKNKEDMHKTLFKGSSKDATGNLSDIYNHKDGKATLHAGGDSMPGQVPTLTSRCTERGGDNNIIMKTFSANANFGNPTAGGDSHAGPVKAYQHDMSGHAEQCVEKYLELANMTVADLKKVATPHLDEYQFTTEDFETKGVLSPVASRIVLKVLYLARICRVDLLWGVNVLAREVTKWNVACDKRLHRLISYLHVTSNWVLTSIVGDKPEDCRIAAFCDASFVAELQDSKSTTGGFVAIVGPRTFVPVIWPCKKQGAVSHSSTEAEVISMEAVLRCEGIPSVILWEIVIDVMSPKGPPPAKSNPARGIFKMEGMLHEIDSNPTTLGKPSGRAKVVVLEDNDAVIKMTVKGRSPAMRHITRTHRVDTDWLFERFQNDPGISIKYVNTKQQIADILTKGSFTSIQWNALCDLAQVGPPGMPQGNPKNVKPSPPMREVTPNAKKAKKGKQKGSKENISPGISKANLCWNNIYIL